MADAAAALEGARWILIETFAEDAELVGGLRELLWDRGECRSTVVAGKEEEGREVLRLLRRQRAGEADCRRTARSRCSAAARKACCAWRLSLPDDDGAVGPTEPERRIAGARRHRRTRAAPPTRGCAETVRWTWRSSCCRSSSTRSNSGCASRPKRRRSASSAATCTTCCWPRRPASASRWGSTRGSAPASRSRSSTAPASCSRPRRSTRTSRARTGTARCARWPRCAHGTTCSSSPSATARPRAKPTSSPPI